MKNLFTYVYHMSWLFHHLIEVRFENVKGVAEWLGSKTDKWKCIVVEAGSGTAEHYKLFTKPWKEAIGYKGKAAGWTKKTTITATLDDIKTAAREIYKDYPEFLNAYGLWKIKNLIYVYC